jgi:hypothetical protein
MPDLLINGGGSGGNGSIDGLLGPKFEMMGTKMKPLSSGTI